MFMHIYGILQTSVKHSTKKYSDTSRNYFAINKHWTSATTSLAASAVNISGNGRNQQTPSQNLSEADEPNYP